MLGEGGDTPGHDDTSPHTSRRRCHSEGRVPSSRRASKTAPPPPLTRGRPTASQRPPARSMRKAMEGDSAVQTFGAAPVPSRGEARPPTSRSPRPGPRLPTRLRESPRRRAGPGRPRQSDGAGPAGARRPLTCPARRSRASAAGPRPARAAAPAAAVGRAATRGQQRQRRGASVAPGPRRGARRPGASPFSPPRLPGRRTRGPRGSDG